MSEIMQQIKNENNNVNENTKEEDDDKNEGKIDDRTSKNIVSMSESDWRRIKECILFKNWSETTFKTFVDERRIFLKRFKYKELIANDKECKKNIFIVKSGEALVLVKITRIQIKKFQKNLEKYSNSALFFNSNIESEKEHFERNKKLDAESNNYLVHSKYLNVFAGNNSNSKINEGNSQQPNGSRRYRKRILKRPRFPVTMQHINNKTNSSKANNNINNNKRITWVDNNDNHISSNRSNNLLPPIAIANNPNSSDSCHYSKSRRITFDDQNDQNVSMRLPSPFLRLPVLFRALNPPFLSRITSTNHNDHNDHIESDMEFIPETTDEEDLVARRLSQRLSVASSTTLPNMNEKRESPNEADENTQHELERCERIRTKYPEVWPEIFKKNPDYLSSCYVKVMKLHLNDIFGLNDYLFDAQREKEKVMDVHSSKRHYEESGSSDEGEGEEKAGEGDATEGGEKDMMNFGRASSDGAGRGSGSGGGGDGGGASHSVHRSSHHDENSWMEGGGRNKHDDVPPTAKKFNKYGLITNSKLVELYVIDKEAYLKNMLTFTSDKSVVNKYLDKLRDSFSKLPLRHEMDEIFFQHLTWNLYKKREYEHLVASSHQANKTKTSTKSNKQRETVT